MHHCIHHCVPLLYASLYTSLCIYSSVYSCMYLYTTSSKGRSYYLGGRCKQHLLLQRAEFVEVPGPGLQAYNKDWVCIHTYVYSHNLQPDNYSCGGNYSHVMYTHAPTLLTSLYTTRCFPAIAEQCSALHN